MKRLVDVDSLEHGLSSADKEAATSDCSNDQGQVTDIFKSFPLWQYLTLLDMDFSNPESNGTVLT